jgi:hypothetical protein
MRPFQGIKIIDVTQVLAAQSKKSARGNPVGGCGGGAASAPPHVN